MRVVGYVRVSTNGQAEDGLGLEIQEAAIRKWAKEHSHRIVAIKTDAGISGSNGLDTRLGLAEALELLKERQAGGLVVYRLDRLARDLMLQEQLLADIWRLEAEPFSTSPGEAGFLADDPDDPSRKLIRQLLGAVSEYERSMIALRLRSGRARKALKGGYAHGRPPFGFRASGGELVTDETEQKVIAQIAGMKRAGKSLREIAGVLESDGHKPRGGGKWHPETLRLILQRQSA